MKNKFSVKFRNAINYYQQGDYHQAIAICNILIEKNCKEIDVYRLLIDSHISVGNDNAAAKNLYLLVKRVPDNASFHYQLSVVLLRLGRIQESLKQSKLTVHLNPKHLDAWLLIASSAGQLGDYDEAISASMKAIAISPENLSVNMNLAAAYDAVNQTERAQEFYEKAALINPNHSIIQCKLGDAYIIANNKDKAEICYRRAITLDPLYTHPYRQISRLKKYTSVNHGDFHCIDTVLKNDKLQDKQTVNLHFALGKMYEDCKFYDKSFEHYKKANSLENLNTNFSNDSFTNLVGNIRNFFNKEYFDNQKISGLQSEVPVFIIGMPRSGTTLIEQIIASLPECYGSGELYWFGQIESKLNTILKTELSYPDIFASINEEQCHILAKEYLNYLEDLTEEGAYKKITDKLPGNFLHIGLITTLFPNAKFIHCKRNPLDTCFSIYSILFPGSMPFSYSLENIAFVYNEYYKLMAHWQELLSNKILTIHYEDIINNQVVESKRMIDFIGIEWSDVCLDFYKNDNPVKTISAFQVRKELYTSSINRWKNYQVHLKPLINKLDKDLMEPYEND